MNRAGMSVALLSAALVLTSVSFAESDPLPAATQKSSKPSAAKLYELRGVVGGDGKTFTTSAGRKWKVMNPEALKGHEGHHRMLSGRLFPDTGAMEVTSILGYALAK
jgi:hypothetical protein